MPKNKPAKTGQVAKNKKAILSKTKMLPDQLPTQPMPSKTHLSFFKKKTFLIIIVAIIVLVSFYKKDLLIAATVNGSPISNLELQLRLNQLYAKKELLQMIDEKIIKDAIRKNNITVSQDEINNKISQIEQNVGGAQTLDAMLSAQNQTRALLKDQITIQVGLEKLLAKETTISDQEVDQFMKASPDLFQSTDSAQNTQKAQDIIKQQKLSQVFDKKFEELKKAANIQIF